MWYHIAAYVGLWAVISIPLGLIVARFIAFGSKQGDGNGRSKRS